MVAINSISVSGQRLRVAVSDSDERSVGGQRVTAKAEVGTWSEEKAWEIPLGAERFAEHTFTFTIPRSDLGSQGTVTVKNTSAREESSRDFQTDADGSNGQEEPSLVGGVDARTVAAGGSLLAIGAAYWFTRDDRRR